MKLYIVRHAETDLNKEDKMNGQGINVQINENGIRQAKKLKLELANITFDKCYVSPLIRTWSTAMILVGDRLEITQDDRLKERCLGIFEGKDKKTYDYKKYWDYQLNSNDEGVEPLQDLFKRCKDFLDDITSKNKKDANILIVTHGGCVRCFHHLINKTKLDGNLLIEQGDNCSCHIYEI